MNTVIKLAPTLPVLFGLLMTGCAEEKAVPESFKLSDVLSPGIANMQLMTVEHSERITALSEKMTAAVAEDPAWWIEHVRKAKPGEPIDYDEKLGLTEAEYQEFLEPKTKPKLAASEVRFETEFRLEDDNLRIRGMPGDLMLADLQINILSGKLKNGAEIEAAAEWKSNPTGGVLGPWTGYLWKYESGDFDSGSAHIFSLDILRAKSDGSIYWSIKEKRLVDGKMVRNVDVILKVRRGR